VLVGDIDIIGDSVYSEHAELSIVEKQSGRISRGDRTDGCIGVLPMISVEEFQKLPPAFESAYEKCYPSHQTLSGKQRHRAGGGAKGLLNGFADRLLFILIYEKTNPLQTMHGLQFGLSQPQTNDWIHQLLAVLQQALAESLHETETRRRSGRSLFQLEGAPALAINGSERRWQHPKDDESQKQHYRGKKKTPTDKSLLLVNETTGKVVLPSV
jgi:Helix-turn-helix of DDE superfamily endonuclease